MYSYIYSSLIWLSILGLIVSCETNNNPKKDSHITHYDLSKADIYSLPPNDAHLVQLDANRVQPDAKTLKDNLGPDLNCSLQARCHVLDSGTYAECFDESNPNPCCGPRVHCIITYACNGQTGQCLTFADDCLPPGWIKKYIDAQPDIKLDKK